MGLSDDEKRALIVAWDHWSNWDPLSGNESPLAYAPLWMRGVFIHSTDDGHGEEWFPDPLLVHLAEALRESAEKDERITAHCEELSELTRTKESIQHDRDEYYAALDAPEQWTPIEGVGELEGGVVYLGRRGEGPTSECELDDQGSLSMCVYESAFGGVYKSPTQILTRNGAPVLVPKMGGGE